jgi:hypothetical protein
VVEALKPRGGGLRAGTEEVQRRDEAAGQADGPGGSAQEPGLSVTAACKRIGPQLGILPDTLPGWCKQADIDEGLAPGVSAVESEELKRLQPDLPAPDLDLRRIRRRSALGGLINEYERAA